jgi:hypothetical protein
MGCRLGVWLDKILVSSQAIAVKDHDGAAPLHPGKARGGDTLFKSVNSLAPDSGRPRQRPSNSHRTRLLWTKSDTVCCHQSSRLGVTLILTLDSYPMTT